MTRPLSRRNIVESITGVFAAPFLVHRAAAQVTPDITRFHAEIEPLVALIERTPRDECPEVFAQKLRSGVSYRQLLAALFLAGVRNVNPRPPGFALHCVFVIHSAHLISLEAPADLRLLPLFYALDNFKAAQERDARQSSGDFTMKPVKGPLFSYERAAAEFSTAMETWDADRAERAVVSLARYRNATEAFELLWRYGARDYRNIGHKAIYVANAHRTLQTIGWQHAEPVLQSLVLSLLDFGKQQQVNGYAFDDQCFTANLSHLQKIFPSLDGSWTAGMPDKAATKSIVENLRKNSPDDACADIGASMAKGKISAASIWDAVHLGAAELSMSVRERSLITGIHAVTAANALHYAYLSAADPKVRFLVLMQAVGWMGQFRKWAGTREDGLRSFSILQLEAPGENQASLDEIFDAIPSNVDASAGRVFALAPALAERQAFISAALRMTLIKADEVHYYKYLAALIEDTPLMSTAWQPHLLAASVYYLKGSKDPAAAATKRAQEALHI